jgi:hypothetical protein
VDKLTLVSLIHFLSPGGTIFYLTLPSLDPIPSTVIQPTRGVIAFALDDSDGRRNHHISPPSQANPSSNNLGNSAGAGAMQGPPEWVSFCVMREKQITLYNLAQRLQRVRVSTPPHAPSLFIYSLLYEPLTSPAHESPVRGFL